MTSKREIRRLADPGANIWKNLAGSDDTSSLRSIELGGAASRPSTAPALVTKRANGSVQKFDEHVSPRSDIHTNVALNMKRNLL